MASIDSASTRIVPSGTRTVSCQYGDITFSYEVTSGASLCLDDDECLGSAIIYRAEHGRPLSFGYEITHQRDGQTTVVCRDVKVAEGRERLQVRTDDQRSR